MSLAVAGETIIAAFNEPGVYISSDEGYNWHQADIYASLRKSPFVIAANKNFIIGEIQLAILINLMITV